MTRARRRGLTPGAMRASGADRTHPVKFSWLPRVAPGLEQLRHYQREWVRGDLLAGLTVGAYLIPQVMAYAVVAGLSPVTGLWASLGPLLVYALLGSSRQLSIGPESSTALMTAAAIATLSAQSGAGPADIAVALAAAVGAVCVVGWLCRLGFVSNLLSKPVLVGYMVGIAVLMIYSQLGALTGTVVTGDSITAQLRSLIEGIRRAQGPTLLLGASALTLLFVLARLRPRWPTPLMVIVTSTLVVHLGGPASWGIAVVGAIPSGLPRPAVPQFDGLDPGLLILAAVGVSIVAYSDTIVTARAFAVPGEPEVNAQSELLALGAANLAAATLQGFPVSSSASRTAVGQASGSKTQLSSLVTLLTVIAAIVLLAPAVAAFPRAVLAAMVVYAATRLIEVGEIRRISRFRRSELVLCAATASAVVAFGVLYGLLVAIGLSLLDLLRRISRPHDGILGYVPGVAGMHDVDDYAISEQIPGLVVYRYDAPLFFANADDFLERAWQAATTSAPVSWFVLNSEAVTEIDLTAVDALEKLRSRLADRGIVFALARVKHDLQVNLDRAGLLTRLGDARVYMTLPEAVEAYRAWCRDQLDDDADPSDPAPRDPSGP